MRGKGWFICAALAACSTGSTRAAVQAGIAPQERQLLQLLDAARVRADIQHLSEDIIKSANGVGDDSIVSGSGEEAAMARHLADRFRELGLTVRVEEYPVRAYRYDPVTLRADGQAIPAISLHATGTTWGRRDGVDFARGNAEGGRLLRAALVDAGEGYAPDYARIGEVRGKVVLVHREKRDWPPAQITEAAHHGAAGILFYDHYAAGPDQADALRQDSLWAHEQLPTAAISLRSAKALQQRLAAGPVQIELNNHVVVGDGTSRNVIATLRGTQRPDEWVMVSGHFDRWFRGAADDTSGAAAVLEMARVFSAAPFKPRRSMLFVAAGSEEAGLEDPERDWLAGSYAFVLRHPEVMRNAALIFNIDGFGWTSKQTVLATSADLLDYHRSLLADLGLAGRVSVRPTVGSTTDAWNFGLVGGAGLASLITIDDSYFPIYHTQLDVYRPERFQDMDMNLRVLALDLMRAANLERLPVVLSSLAGQVDGLLTRDAAKAKDADFADARAALKELRAAALAVEAMRDGEVTDAINHLLISVRHTLLPWMYMDNGDYEQDVRTAPYAVRIEALDRALSALRGQDRAATAQALTGFYEGRQCQRLSAPVYAAERNFWASENGWASRFAQRAAPPPPAFEAACRSLGTASDEAAVAAGLGVARADALATLTQSLALIATKARAAAYALDEFSGRSNAR